MKINNPCFNDLILLVMRNFAFSHFRALALRHLYCEKVGVYEIKGRHIHTMQLRMKWLATICHTRELQQLYVYSKAVDLTTTAREWKHVSGTLFYDNIQGQICSYMPLSNIKILEWLYKRNNEIFCMFILSCKNFAILRQVQCNSVLVRHSIWFISKCI